MIVSLQEVQQIKQHAIWPAAPATSLTAEREMIVFGGGDSHIRLAVSTQRGALEEIAAFRAPHGGLQALAFGADDSQLFSGHQNGFVVAYALPECVMQAQQHVEDHFDGVRSLRWLSQRSLLAVASRFSIQLLDADTLQRTRLVTTGHQHVYALAVGRSMLASCVGGAINFFDATTFERVAQIPSGRSAYVLDFSPNQRRLLVAARNFIAVCAVDDARAAVSIERRVRVDDFVVQACVWLDDEHMVGVGAGQMAVWRATRGDRLAHWSRVQPMICRSLAALSQQRLLVTDNDGGNMYIYRLYNLRGECDATAALYHASLLVFASLRRTALGAHAMQLNAEAAADDRIGLLSDRERTRIFTAARVSRRVRAARLATLASMDSDCERMQWLLSAPLYTFDQLAPLGAIDADEAAVEPESSAWFCSLI